MKATPAVVLSLTDRELQQRNQCSMFVPLKLDPLQDPAERTLRWALRERHIGKIHKAAEIREHFTGGWVKAWAGPEKDQEYWAGPKAALTFGRRVYEFLLKYEVLHPYEPYTLQLDRGQITGENAVVLWARSESRPVPMVVDALLRRPTSVRVPNFMVLAHWLAARQALDDLDLGIVHLPLTIGAAWGNNDIKEPLARRWLNAILNTAADQPKVPRAGTQCVNCTHPCKEIFGGPDGHSWA